MAPEDRAGMTHAASSTRVRLSWNLGSTNPRVKLSEQRDGEKLSDSVAATQRDREREQRPTMDG
jgi:hypothetical protein